MHMFVMSIVVIIYCTPKLIQHTIQISKNMTSIEAAYAKTLKKIGKKYNNPFDRGSILENWKEMMLLE
ncbi:MAG: hypothetical protein EZS28_051307 [Streblomastix strix]|uniref:Uncharacterized protein n=1 Tax=Streblomastix strix TaxID=222440 RepID=A0A5J4T3Y0_9EUKA|nr:MAG: hypothetical protein EZS28_051307 [Streblomastix strix]